LSKKNNHPTGENSPNLVNLQLYIRNVPRYFRYTEIIAQEFRKSLVSRQKFVAEVKFRDFLLLLHGTHNWKVGVWQFFIGRSAVEGLFACFWGNHKVPRTYIYKQKLCGAILLLL
jgi:hypothetical protein